MSDTLEWLLEEDEDSPGVRYFALRDLLGRAQDDADLVEARRQLMSSGPVPAILSAQDKSGYWVKSGTGYYPKYRGSVWSIIYLAQLGADPTDERVQAGAEYLLENGRADSGVFSLTGTQSGSVHCLNGSLCAALLDLGCEHDPRVRLALDLMARFVTGDGVAVAGDRLAPLYYLKSGTCGPGFCCSANDRLACAWGAVKVLRGLARVPETTRTAEMRAALDATVKFLFSVDPATAGYPAGYSDKPSRSWFKFGFPLFYVTDILQIAEALTEAGCAGDDRLSATYDLILGKRDKAGRWKMEYTYQGKTFADVEQLGQPSKWVTLRAMRVLQAAGRLA